MTIRSADQLPYTLLCNELLQDVSLSLESTAIAVFILSFPGNCGLSNEELARRRGVEVSTLKAALGGLEERGYLTLNESLDAAGRSTWEWKLTDSLVNDLSEVSA